MIELLEMHASQIIWGASAFGLSLVLSVAAVLFVIVRLEPDHFHRNRQNLFWAHRPAWQRILGIAAKNLLGFLLFMLGIVMALPGVPGQGLLTMFIGLVLLDVPGKRAVERRIIGLPAILRACNRLRMRYGKLPLVLDKDEDKDENEITGITGHEDKPGKPEMTLGAAPGRQSQKGDELPDEGIRIGFE